MDRAEKIILYMEQLKNHYEEHQNDNEEMKQRYKTLNDLLEQVKTIQ